jgi:hypothetical protein
LNKTEKKQATKLPKSIFKLRNQFACSVLKVTAVQVESFLVRFNENGNLYGSVINVKVKFTLEEAAKAQKGEYMCRATLSLTSALDEVSGQSYTPAALPSEKTQYPFF